MNARAPSSSGWLPAMMAALILLIGWIDFATGPDIGFSLFYLIPIAITGWAAGRTAAVFLAFEAAACWLTADLLWQAGEQVHISAWNGATRLVIYMTIGILTARTRQDRRQLEAANRRLEELLAVESRLARIDPLTELANSREFLERAKVALNQARAAARPIAMVYFDADNFKAVNDEYGHAAGNECLRRIASVIAGHVRSGDLVGRLGGDEFAALFVGLGESQVREIAERIAAAVENLEPQFAGTGLGLSGGLAHFEVAPDELDTVIGQADRAMYEAKAARKQRTSR